MCLEKTVWTLTTSPGGVHFLRWQFHTCGSGSSSSKALGYGLDGLGSIPGVGGVEIFLRSFMSRLVLRSTQPPIK